MDLFVWRKSQIALNVEDPFLKLFYATAVL